MIIQSLTEQYTWLKSQGKVPRLGWSRSGVNFSLVLSEKGEILSVVDLRTKEKKKRSSQVLIIPEQVIRTTQLKPYFLADNAMYLLGLDTKNNPEKAKEAFSLSKKFHEEILAEVDVPAARAVLHFFQRWQPEDVEKHKELNLWIKELKKGGTIVFTYRDQHVFDYQEIQQQWENYLSKEEKYDGVCSVTGKQAKIARLHPLIKGIHGAQLSGASLISFNAEAYTSHGKKQGMNAPISEKVAFEYGAMLNYLLSNESTHKLINDTTYVFWSKTEIGTRSFLEMLTGYQQTVDIKVTQIQLKAAMQELAEGRSIVIADEELSADTDFYLLGLSPNAARLSVRFFTHNKFSFFAKNLAAHQKRLSITRPQFDQRQELGIFDILTAITNEKTRDKRISPSLAGSITQAMLLDSPYPYALITTLSTRIKADRKITRDRAAIIKAFYLKNKNSKCPEEVLQVSLNEETQNIPYLLGREFAILEKIQWLASNEQSSQERTEEFKTICDKYFNAATANPAYIFPILIKLTNHYLTKLKSLPQKNGARILLEKTLGEILAKIDLESMPKQLTLPEQGAFQLGYYHQKEAEFKKAALKKLINNKGE
ncbi:type I-C CRISPR-associated protein Cas8c/Csd1 [Enterococcus nangangensis]|uniref:type I-C CRISPR-associated protein Cas8c/Csd1 n=1 Tax=Enterococcus nangangensis TaxID=2559926 RepID=UPI0010FA5948|nr:type I-C CRISPR-associated protein Cas8c/Csd1 [Enterococcus nangangensis]